MFESISEFCMSIICTTMMVIILEMIMPEGKSKKYVTFVCGVVVTFVLIEPIISLLNINIDEVFANVTSNYEEVKYDESLYTNSIKESYEQTLINDVIIRLRENGYNIMNVEVDYDEDTLQPTRMYMDLINEDGFVQPVKIEVSTQSNPNTTIRERINKE